MKVGVFVQSHDDHGKWTRSLKYLCPLHLELVYLVTPFGCEWLPLVLVLVVVLEDLRVALVGHRLESHRLTPRPPIRQRNLPPRVALTMILPLPLLNHPPPNLPRPRPL